MVKKFLSKLSNSRYSSTYITVDTENSLIFIHMKRRLWWKIVSVNWWDEFDLVKTIKQTDVFKNKFENLVKVRSQIIP